MSAVRLGTDEWSAENPERYCIYNSALQPHVGGRYYSDNEFWVQRGHNTIKKFHTLEAATEFLRRKLTETP